MGIGVEGVRNKGVGSWRYLLIVFSLFHSVRIGGYKVLFWIRSCDHVFSHSLSIDRRDFD